MRTTFDLPDILMKNVQFAFPSKTKKGSFLEAVRKGLQSKAYEELAKMEGSFPRLKINIAKLRGRNRHKKWL